MKLIEEIDKCHCKLTLSKQRKASRGIIFVGDKLLLIKSQKYQEYKFPGGGVKEHEYLKQALIREVLEETGYDVVSDSIKEYGKIVERHIDSFDSTRVFEQTSYYFLCDVVDNKKQQSLDDYEKEYGYEIKIVDVDEAIQQNELVKNSGPDWIEREIAMMKHIRKDILNRK